ncbi:MAG: VanW family protein [Chloroflexota bacterium]|nr:VanW family protein [Chloroflexota bacterium]
MANPRRISSVEADFDAERQPPTLAGVSPSSPYYPLLDAAPVHDEAAFNVWLIRLPILAISGAILWAMLMALIAAAYLRTTDGRIIPGVSIAGMNVGGMTPAAALAAVEMGFTYDDSAVFTFREPTTGQFWQFPARDLGVTLDATATIQAASALGSDGNLLSDGVEQALVWLNGRALAPVVRYDQAAALAALARIAAEIDRPAIDARLTFDGARVETTPAQIGRVVDVRATLARLDAAILALTPGGEIPLVVSDTPPIAWDAENAAAQARAAISAPLILVADDGRGESLGPWTATPEQIAALLSIAPVTDADGTQRYAVSVNLEPFRATLNDLARGLFVPPQAGRFHFDDNARALLMIQSAVEGRTLNVDETLRRMEQALFDPTNRLVLMAFDFQPATYHAGVTAAELGITELISTGRSSYAGSPRARIDNIIVAAARFDGIIIAPGEQFSFNQWVGDITPEEGYVSGKVIYGGRTIDGVGGGVCQVSTTAFRAAFYGGFPMVERHAHGYRVGYYERGDAEGVGMDAAIYTGELDFRFINDTPYHLLIETSVYPATSTVEFRLYSTNVGRRVIRQGPTIQNVELPPATRYEVNENLQSGQEMWVDWAAEGAYVEVERVIVDASGNEIRRERIASQYQAWGAIVQVAPGDARAA